ncbi:SGNH/GDSL hydrolase family protein [Sneathiella marina]|uniref:SGNH/GDSL hydrolase family protein n=1 Tax=Sneathiella marina TaxID=2950108 RepID=A0ABY4W7K0_9PROT|nr:SGNH/GDSL hydrolase family protein [Sneathiella marina]USG60626.1 SGNH/GDSL hydrolase family protein [Sneathiella marina]
MLSIDRSRELTDVKVMWNVLCYGDSNTWGCKPITQFGVYERYDPDVRWPGVLQSTLGSEYKVIEEGLNGRTTVFDDPIMGSDRNGKSYLAPCLETHMPLDLVIIMLGTNDLKPRFPGTTFDIACGAGALLAMAMNPAGNWIGALPKTLLVAPPQIGELTALAGILEGAQERSLKLAGDMKRVAEMLDSPFLDAGLHIQSSQADGVHLEAEDHLVLGQAIAAKVQELLN